MALNSNYQMLYRPTTTTGGAPCSDTPLHRAFLIPSSSTPCWSHPRAHYHPNHHCRHQLTVVVSASKRSFSSSKTGKLDSKNRRNPISTKEDGEEEKESELASEINYGDATGTAEGAVDVDDGFVMPKLPGEEPGEEPDFWEGPQWDGLGFFVQYLWAFSILFAVNFILISAPFHFNFGLLLSILSDRNSLFFVGFG